MASSSVATSMGEAAPHTASSTTSTTIMGTRKLVLHFDVNETILVGDPAGGDTFEQSLNKCIAKNAFVRIPGARIDGSTPLVTQFSWHDGSPMDPSARSTDTHSEPPELLPVWEWPEGRKPFYKVRQLKKRYAREFTEADSPGVIYKSFRDELEQALRLDLDPSQEGNNGTTNHHDNPMSHDGVHHLLIPAFFHTLERLEASGRDFRVVLRTFGTDGPKVAQCMDAWADLRRSRNGEEGGGRDFGVRGNLWLGRYNDEGEYQLHGAEGSRNQGTVLNEHEGIAMLEGGTSPVVIQDHYEWWSKHRCEPSAGKPLWLTMDNRAVQHIFFDDNIHNDPRDSIVAVRVRPSAGEPFTPLNGEETCRLHGAVLRRVATFLPILDQGWFVDRIQECEEAFASGVIEAVVEG